MTVAHKLRIKIGHAEFEAEGTEEVVQSQYERFLAALDASPAAVQNVRNIGNGRQNTAIEQSEFGQQLLDRAFRTDQDSVSLRVLPPDTATRDQDALVLLLFGFLRLQNRQEVSALDLMAAARQSGINRSRIDRAIPEEHIRSGGRGRGTRYSLTNPGISRAEELVESMFE